VADITDKIKGHAESEIFGMKNWNDAKQRWDGVICQVRRDDAGKEFIQIYDVGTAETQVEIDDWIKETLILRPWLRSSLSNDISKSSLSNIKK